MTITAITQHGINKTENEDRVVIGKTILSNGILQCNDNTGIIAIADGVGGNNAGAVASHFVANNLADIQLFSQENLAMLNKQLIEKSNTDSSLSKMATTLSGIVQKDDVCMYFHVGNTRIYSLQNGKYLRQLTDDDTTINYLRKIGQITSDEEAERINKSEITACFGAGDERFFNIKLKDITSMNINTFIITSDGVHEFVDVDQMEEIFTKAQDDTEACKMIVELAVKNGSLDDISIIIARNQ